MNSLPLAARIVARTLYQYPVSLHPIKFLETLTGSLDPQKHKLLKFLKKRWTHHCFSHDYVLSVHSLSRSIFLGWKARISNWFSMRVYRLWFQNWKLVWRRASYPHECWVSLYVGLSSMKTPFSKQVPKILSGTLRCPLKRSLRPSMHHLVSCLRDTLTKSLELSKDWVCSCCPDKRFVMLIVLFHVFFDLCCQFFDTGECPTTDRPLRDEVEPWFGRLLT